MTDLRLLGVVVAWFLLATSNGRAEYIVTGQISGYECSPLAFFMLCHAVNVDAGRHKPSDDLIA